jgi:hypothetical protein
MKPSTFGNVIRLAGKARDVTAGCVALRGAAARLGVAPLNGRLAMDVQTKRDFWIMVAMAVACTIAFAIIETAW